MPPRLRAVEGQQTWGALVGVALGAGQAWWVGVPFVAFVYVCVFA